MGDLWLPYACEGFLAFPGPLIASKPKAAVVPLLQSKDRAIPGIRHCVKPLQCTWFHPLWGVTLSLVEAVTRAATDVRARVYQ